MIDNFFNRLDIDESFYFLTGSRALETEDLKLVTDESDYDYVVDIHFRHNILAWLSENKIDVELSCYNGGFKFMYQGKYYNIITGMWVEFMAWREALSILKHLIKTDPIYQKAVKDKGSRYCLYEQLRGLVKTAIKLGENKT